MYDLDLESFVLFSYENSELKILLIVLLILSELFYKQNSSSLLSCLRRNCDYQLIMLHNKNETEWNNNETDPFHALYKGNILQSATLRKHLTKYISVDNIETFSKGCVTSILWTGGQIIQFFYWFQAIWKRKWTNWTERMDTLTNK